jgi:hypothetical protein
MHAAGDHDEMERVEADHAAYVRDTDRIARR